MSTRFVSDVRERVETGSKFRTRDIAAINTDLESLMGSLRISMYLDTPTLVRDLSD